jgi:hypothetical protein
MGGYYRFGIYVCPSKNIKDVLKLLYKNVNFYKNGKLVEEYDLNLKFDEKYDEVHFIPYDDYLVNNKKPETIIIKNEDEYDDMLYSFDDDSDNEISFEDWTLFIQRDDCWNIFIGICSDGFGFLTCKEMKELMDLHDKLLKQGRIKGDFVCSS